MCQGCNKCKISEGLKNHHLVCNLNGEGGGARIAVSSQLRVDLEEEDPVMKTESCIYDVRIHACMFACACARAAISRRASDV